MYDYDKSLQPNNSSNKLINLHEIYNRLKLLINLFLFKQNMLALNVMHVHVQVGAVIQFITPIT